MPQFAFDGIFAPLSTAPVTPQRSSSAPFDDAMFDEHLAQARRLPEPIRAPEQPQPSPIRTTNPVTPEDRRPAQQEVDNQPKPYKTRDSGQTTSDSPASNAPADSASDRQASGADGARNAESKSNQGDSTPSNEVKDAEPDETDATSDTQHDAVAAALASVELSVKQTVAKTAVDLATSEEALPSEVTDETLNLPAEAIGAKAGCKTIVDKSRAGGENSDANSAPRVLPADAGEEETSLALDPSTTANSAEAAVEETELQDASSSNANEQDTASQVAQTGAQEDTVQVARGLRSKAIDKAANRALGESKMDDGELSKSPLDTESEKPATGARRRESSLERSSDSATKSKTEAPVEQTVATNEVVPTEGDSPTDSGSTATKAAVPTDRAVVLETGTSSTGHESREQHSSGGRSQQQADAVRDVSAERTARQPTVHARDADAVAPRSQLLTDVERMRFVQRVARAIHTSATSADGGQMRLRLSPPELGSLRMEIVVRQGTVTAHVEAESSAARDVLLDNLPALRDRLAEQNIKLERFDVDLMRQSLDQTPQHDGGQAGDRADGERRQNPLASRETKQAVERIAASIPVIQDGHVNVVI